MFSSKLLLTDGESARAELERRKPSSLGRGDRCRNRSLKHSKFVGCSAQALRHTSIFSLPAPQFPADMLQIRGQPTQLKAADSHTDGTRQVRAWSTGTWRQLTRDTTPSR